MIERECQKVVTKLETHNQNPKSGTTCVTPIVRAVVDNFDSIILSIFTPIEKEFSDVSKEFQDKISLICGT